MSVCAHLFFWDVLWTLWTSLFISDSIRDHMSMSSSLCIQRHTQRERELRINELEFPLCHWYMFSLCSSSMALFYGSKFKIYVDFPLLISSAVHLFCLLRLPSLPQSVCEVRGWSEVTEGRCFLPSFEDDCKDWGRNGGKGKSLFLRGVWGVLRGRPQSQAAALEMVALFPTSCFSYKT